MVTFYIWSLSTYQLLLCLNDVILQYDVFNITYGHFLHMVTFYIWSLSTYGHFLHQPRTQALSTTRLAGGKTLVQAGHVSPRFWEITNFLHKGGGLSLFYRSSCRYQFDKVQSVCILTNACNFNERQELVLQNQWVRCLCICILCGLHLRRRYARSIRSSIRTGVFQFHLGKTAKN